MRKFLSFFLACLLSITLTSCMAAVPESPVQPEEKEVELELVDEDEEDGPEESDPEETDPEEQEPEEDPEEAGEPERLDSDGSYTSKDDVALYIHQYGCLPKNFITKKEAEALGWSGGSLQKYAPGKSIGGSRFGNYEGLLPKAKDRTYTECDIDTGGNKGRGAKRIVFSNDGLIYYTDDHYESFTLLYGEEEP